MRNFYQIGSMIGDIILVYVCYSLLMEGSYVLLALILYVWFINLGGLCAWYPSTIKAFMNNVSEIDL